MAHGEGRHGEQLAWERRAAVPVAVAAVLAGLLLVQVLIVQGALIEDRRGLEPTPDYLLSLDEHAGGFLASSLAQSLGWLLLTPVFFFLFRATRYRAPELPEFFKWLVLFGPLLNALATVLGITDRIDVAHQFADGRPIAGDAGDERADDLLGEISAVTLALSFAGQLSVAFLYVMIPLRAMRAGLLSRFMGVLGVIVGVLLVLPLVPGGQVIVQLFWLGAIAALALGAWPGGRGPAWDTGEAIPWPSAAERRGLVAPKADEAAQEAEPEPVPERPASRKRRRKQ